MSGELVLAYGPIQCGDPACPCNGLIGYQPAWKHVDGVLDRFTDRPWFRALEEAYAYAQEIWGFRPPVLAVALA